MLDSVKHTCDAATGLSVGKRERQEDAVAMDFATQSPLGFGVLADGMGGHAAGEIASEIVVNEFYGQLKNLAADADILETNLDRVLRQIIRDANARLSWIVQANPKMTGMGSTLIAFIVVDDRLYWISVGDSPLYLFRGSRLFRLNENHSVASLVDNLAMQGKITAETAIHHPDRHCLTSVINGSVISEIDCRAEPFQLQDGDIVIAASDGLEVIGDTAIARILFENRDHPSQTISETLLETVTDLDHPDQDNVSLCILKVALAESDISKTAHEKTVGSMPEADDPAVVAAVDNIFADIAHFEVEGSKG